MAGVEGVEERAWSWVKNSGVRGSWEWRSTPGMNSWRKPVGADGSEELWDAGDALEFLVDADFVAGHFFFREPYLHGGKPTGGGRVGF